MKYCQYCGREATENTTECPHCGASSFERICKNCGTHYTLNQPYCPNCSKENLRNTGYQSTAKSTFTSTQTPKKKVKNLGLWILGWIFIPPIPFTIVISRTKLPRFAKILLIVHFWLLYCLIAFLSDEENTMYLAADLLQLL